MEFNSLCLNWQAIAWLKERVDVLVKSHADVGRTQEEAERKKTDHEKFQNTAKVEIILKVT